MSFIKENRYLSNDHLLTYSLSVIFCHVSFYIKANNFIIQEHDDMFSNDCDIIEPLF